MFPKTVQEEKNIGKKNHHARVKIIYNSLIDIRETFY